MATHVTHSIECPELGPICLSRSEPPQRHDQWFYSTELRATAQLQLTDLVGVEAQVPLRLMSITIRYLRLDGVEFVPDYPDIHHRNQTLVGFGDPWLAARFRLRLGEFTLGARLGLSLPLGRTESDPFALGRQGLTHEHVQLGAGTVGGVLGLEVQRLLGPVRVAANAQAQHWPLENTHGYRPGTRLGGGLEVSGEPFASLRLGGTLDVSHEEPERWGGVIEQDGNLGRTDLLAGATLAIPVGRFALTLRAQVPLVVRVVHGPGEDGELAYPATVALGVATVFR